MAGAGDTFPVPIMDRAPLTTEPPVVGVQNALLLLRQDTQFGKGLGSLGPK